MSSRHNDYYKGSSRSTRDDSRAHSERHRQDRDRRTRSRSPRRRSSPARSTKHSSKDRSPRNRERTLDYADKVKVSSSHNDWEDSDEEVPPPPPPPRITKISIGFSKPKAPIKMNLGSSAKPSTLGPSNPTIASVFNTDDDEEEPEEMPAEARMRMRNIGRETPTSAGPNSFGKTKQGFCDAKKVFEKNLKEALETAEKPKFPTGKFPQTIYRINGP